MWAIEVPWWCFNNNTTCKFACYNSSIHTPVINNGGWKSEQDPGAVRAQQDCKSIRRSEEFRESWQISYLCFQMLWFGLHHLFWVSMISCLFVIFVFTRMSRSLFLYFISVVVCAFAVDEISKNNKITMKIQSKYKFTTQKITYPVCLQRNKRITMKSNDGAKAIKWRRQINRRHVCLLQVIK